MARGRNCYQKRELIHEIRRCNERRDDWLSFARVRRLAIKFLMKHLRATVFRITRHAAAAVRRLEHLPAMVDYTGTNNSKSFQENTMCDELTAKDAEKYLRRNAITRRQFNKHGAAAALTMLLPPVANALDVVEQELMV